MKRKIIHFTMVGLFSAIVALGQTKKASDVITKLSTVKDQRGETFDPDNADKISTLVFIEGTNTVVTDIYAKFSGKKPVKGVAIIGGWKDVMPQFSEEKKYDHLKDVFIKLDYPVYIDVSSVTLDLLNLDRYSIVILNHKKNTVDIQDFGTDRLSFLKALDKFYN